MKHTKIQAVRAKNKLINYFNYRPSDFYETERDWIHINTEDCEISTYDTYKEIMTNYEK